MKRGMALIVFMAVCLAVISTYYSSPSTETAVGQKIKVGFIGDSITQGRDKEKDVVDMTIDSLGDTFVGVNKGVSGTTTADWQPGQRVFEDAVTTFRSQNVRVVSVMLGTNDARSDKLISPSVYFDNMRRITKGLLSTGVVDKVIINSPPYVKPGTYGLWNKMSLALLAEYSVRLDVIGGDTRVVRGDTAAYDDFKRHPSLLADGVHPTSEGAKQLSWRWAQALRKAQRVEIARKWNLPAVFAVTRL